MRKLLTCTTALSLALSPISGLPARAQTLADDGSVIGPDGSILCTPSEGVSCDPEAIKAQLAADAAAAAAQAQAEAEAAAQAEAEAAAQAAAEEAARREAEARAAEEAAARAAAEAAAQAEAEAAAKAAEEAAAAEAAAQAEAEAAAQAAAEEAARREAEARAAEEATARAAAEAAAQAEAEAAAKAAEEAAAADETPVAETAEPPVGEEPPPATATDAPEAVTEAPAAETAPEAPAPEAVVEAPAPAEPAVEPSAEAAVEPVPEPVSVPEPAPGSAAGPVDSPEVSVEAADSLAEILATPPAAEGGAVEENLGAAAAAAAVIDPETLLPILPAAPAEVGPADATDGSDTSPAPEPVSVATEIVSDETTRASDQEFQPAPAAAAAGKKKSGLSDLEKVGLLALGALVVGAVINDGKKDRREVVEATGDRVVVRNPDGSYDVYKDDDAVLRRPGVKTVTESYRDGSTRTVVVRPDGTQVVTVRDASGRVLRRSVYDRSGIETVLIDDLYPEEPIIISELPRPRPGRVTIATSDSDAALKAELAALEAEEIGRKFSLRQIREIAEVRALAATIEVDSITFDSGSSVISATEARKLADLGKLMQNLLADNPRHVFLIEGHTDAVGSGASNLLLSDRRAESLALALTEYFDIPPENLVVQGYGESELKIETQGNERANRRVVARLITPLMRRSDLR